MQLGCMQMGSGGQQQEGKENRKQGVVEGGGGVRTFRSYADLSASPTHSIHP